MLQSESNSASTGNTRTLHHFHYSCPCISFSLSPPFPPSLPPSLSHPLSSLWASCRWAVINCGRFGSGVLVVSLFNNRCWKNRGSLAVISLLLLLFLLLMLSGFFLFCSAFFFFTVIYFTTLFHRSSIYLSYLSKWGGENCGCPAALTNYCSLIRNKPPHLPPSPWSLIMTGTVGVHGSGRRGGKGKFISGGFRMCAVDMNVLTSNITASKCLVFNCYHKSKVLQTFMTTSKHNLQTDGGK